MIKLPIPKPRKGESKKQFIPRCISELSHIDSSRPRKQIIAMCFSSWRESKGESLSKVILPKEMCRWAEDM